MKAEKRKRKNLFFSIAVVALSVYIIISLIQLQLQLSKGQRRLNDLNTQLKMQLVINEELQGQIDNYESYLEQQARRQGMALPGETILIEIPKD